MNIAITPARLLSVKLGLQGGKLVCDLLFLSMNNANPTIDATIAKLDRVLGELEHLFVFCL